MRPAWPGPKERKRRVSPGSGRGAMCTSALSVVIPGDWGQIRGFWKGLGSPGKTRADHSLSADSGPPPLGEGARRGPGLSIKARAPGTRAASAFASRAALTRPVNTLCWGGGGREEGELLAAPIQPRGPSHATRVGQALVRQRGSQELSAWSHPSCPQQHEQRPRAGPGARLSHALG